MSIERQAQRSFAFIVIDSAESQEIIECAARLLMSGVRVLNVTRGDGAAARSHYERLVPKHLLHRLYHYDSQRLTAYSRSGEPLVREPLANLTLALKRVAWENELDPRDVLIASSELRDRIDTCECVFADRNMKATELLRGIVEHLESGRFEPLPDGPHSDSGWLVLREGYDPARELEVESLLTVSNGYAGTRGTVFERGSPLGPGTLVAGIFEQISGEHSVPALVAAPEWVRLRISILTDEEEDEGVAHDLLAGAMHKNHRVLDMATAMMWRELRHEDTSGRITSIRGFRLASQEDRHLFLQSLTVVPENYSGRLRLEAEADLYPSPHKSYLNPYPRKVAVVRTREDKGEPIVVTYSYEGGSQIAIAQRGALNLPDGRRMSATVSRIENRVANVWEFEAELGKSYRLDKTVSIYTTRDAPKPAKQAKGHSLNVAKFPMERHVAAHLDHWKSRWSVANVEIEGDPESERSLRFACYGLLSAANPEDERVSIGARALTGNSYLGHVFWDTEIFMLPFFISAAPDIARSLLMYRYHTLPGARKNARRCGYRGAMYAWESANTGEETTPRYMMTPLGEKIRVITGDQEHHITADVAYMIWQYWLYTGDQAFIRGPGAEILLETARFWASRVIQSADGKYHIEHAIGPDEYHEDISDNAFTNEMARWNLRCAARLANELRLQVSEKEIGNWQMISDGIIPPRIREGVIEQFRGYFGLEDQTISMNRQPGGADFRIFLDFERLQRTQLLKQADVVMLQYLLENQFSKDERRRSFDYYEMRTLHGSSLSPAIYGVMAARLGLRDAAFRYFKMAADVDLENNMGNASGGLHSAAQGGLWQGAIMGFAGMQAAEEGLRFSPVLPSHWRELRFHVHWRGQLLIIRASDMQLEVLNKGWGAVKVGALGTPLRDLAPGESRRWKPVGPQTADASWQEVA